MISDFINDLEVDLCLYKNKAKANGMSKYMKNKFVYFGISSPERKNIQKIHFKKWIILLDKQEKWDLIAFLWEKEEREFQYVAIDWIKTWKLKNYEIEDIEHLTWLISQKSWWDSVDLLASNAVGIYFVKYPEKIQEIIDDWRNSENMWLNRSCLIYQLKYKEKTDFELLKSLILQYKDQKEFFIQKAIGWSLRSYADCNPMEVQNFVNTTVLSNLAKKEALRKL